MQLYAKLHKKDSSRAQGLFAALSEVNAAIASFNDFCRNPLCCGKRKFAKHLYADCWRRGKGNNNLQTNLIIPKSFVGNRDGFKPDSRGKNFSGKPFTNSNNIINLGSNPPSAGGKFNSFNSHKFNEKLIKWVPGKLPKRPTDEKTTGHYWAIQRAIQLTKTSTITGTRSSLGIYNKTWWPKDVAENE